MKRREFITLLGGAAAGWPIAARAQQSAMPVVGFLDAGSATERTQQVAAFRKGLAEGGYQEGQNVALEFAWAEGQYNRFAELAAQLVRRQVAVIAVPGSGIGALAAKAATTTIPIVFGATGDPVKEGLVASLSRPGGNMTGAALLTTALVGKQLDLLREMVPRATTFAYLTDPRVPTAGETTSDIAAAARALNRHLTIAEARSASDIESAIATLVQRGNDALIVSPYQLFDTNMNSILGLAARHNIPAIYHHSGWVRGGGLMSYGAKSGTADKIIVDCVVRILRGAKPANLPVQQPTEFDLVINLKTAKTFDLTIPPTLYAFATKVIE